MLDEIVVYKKENPDVEIYNCDCVEAMKVFPEMCIDLTVTSPPYDNLRTYNGYSVDMESVIKQLFRITKEGGVVVWVVGDATVNGTESGSSFKQALKFIDVGFNLHDTMIYQKKSCYAHDPRNKRYKQMFEYMFVFSKGRVKTYNEIRDVRNIHAGKKLGGTKGRNKSGIKRKLKEVIIGEFQARSNIWMIPSSEHSEHPAIFPEKLANDHIVSWSNYGDVVFDPFCGSGTTAKMSILNGRHFYGCEISSEYCDIIKKRLDGINQPTPREG